MASKKLKIGLNILGGDTTLADIEATLLGLGVADVARAQVVRDSLGKLVAVDLSALKLNQTAKDAIQAHSGVAKVSLVPEPLFISELNAATPLDFSALSLSPGHIVKVVTADTQVPTDMVKQTLVGYEDDVGATKGDKNLVGADGTLVFFNNLSGPDVLSLTAAQSATWDGTTTVLISDTSDLAVNDRITNGIKQQSLFEDSRGWKIQSIVPNTHVIIIDADGLPIPVGTTPLYKNSLVGTSILIPSGFTGSTSKSGEILAGLTPSTVAHGIGDYKGSSHDHSFSSPGTVAVPPFQIISGQEPLDITKQAIYWATLEPDPQSKTYPSTALLLIAAGTHDVAPALVQGLKPLEQAASDAGC
jgi:hypothetical protein